MKLQTINNTIEFKDVVFEGAYKNMANGSNLLEHAGLPDLCVIYKRFKKAIQIFKNKGDFEQAQTSFHFVTGLCPSSQADISAYFSQLLSAQEQSSNYKLFQNGEFEIYKITYTCYDFFSRILVVSQIEITSTGQSLSQYKNYGFDYEKKLFVAISDKHWEECYISSVLRAIDNECRLPSAGKFFKNFQLQTKKQIEAFLKKYISLLNVTNVQVPNNFCFQNIDNTLFQMHWSLGVLVGYLERICMLEVLDLFLRDLEDNMILHLLKALISYKIKKYEQALPHLANILVENPHFGLALYLQAKAFDKMKEFSKAFLILQHLLIYASSNYLVWIELANLFRKVSHFQISIILLNKASKLLGCDHTSREKHCLSYLNNYKILCGNKSIVNCNHLENIFELITPECLERSESFVQLSQKPRKENLLVKQRQNEPLDSKVKSLIIYLEEKFEVWFKQQIKNGLRVTEEQSDMVFRTKLLELNDQENDIFYELLKIAQIIGVSKFQNLYQNVFVKKKIQNVQQDKIIVIGSEDSKFKFRASQESSIIIDQNRSMNIPKLQDEIQYSDEEENMPSFLKHHESETLENELLRVEKQKQSFDQLKQQRLMKRSLSTKNQRAPSLQFLKSFKGSLSVKGKRQVQLKTVIQETANESIESERINQFKKKCKFIIILQYQELNCLESYAPSSGQAIKEERSKIIIGSLGILISSNPNKHDSQQLQAIEEIRRKYEDCSANFEEIVVQFIQVALTFEKLFMPGINQQQKFKSVGQTPETNSPLFKSKLTQTLKNKQHLGEKATEIKEFYIMPQLQQLDNQNSPFALLYNTHLKTETLFLYKCAQLSIKIKLGEISKQLLMKLNSKIISVQITDLLLGLPNIQSDPKLVIRQYNIINNICKNLKSAE